MKDINFIIKTNGEILEVDKVIQLNSRINRFFIKLKNGNSLWIWEDSANVQHNFKCYSLLELRKLKLDKINELHNMVK